MHKREYKNEVEKRVYESYPVTKKEKRCASERTKREYMRAELRKHIYGDNGATLQVTEETWNKN